MIKQLCVYNNCLEYLSLCCFINKCQILKDTTIACSALFVQQVTFKYSKYTNTAFNYSVYVYFIHILFTNVCY